MPAGIAQKRNRIKTDFSKVSKGMQSFDFVPFLTFLGYDTCVNDKKMQNLMA